MPHLSSHSQPSPRALPPFVKADFRPSRPNFQKFLDLSLPTSGRPKKPRKPKQPPKQQNPLSIPTEPGPTSDTNNQPSRDLLPSRWRIWKHFTRVTYGRSKNKLVHSENNAWMVQLFLFTRLPRWKRVCLKNEDFMLTSFPNFCRGDSWFFSVGVCSGCVLGW
jgi:hypothetical protein